jgi:hypothetical protein
LCCVLHFHVVDDRNVVVIELFVLWLFGDCYQRMTEVECLLFFHLCFGVFVISVTLLTGFVDFSFRCDGLCGTRVPLGS